MKIHAKYANELSELTPPLLFPTSVLLGPGRAVLPVHRADERPGVGDGQAPLLPGRHRGRGQRHDVRAQGWCVSSSCCVSVVFPTYCNWIVSTGPLLSFS
jgi:hypothetical protein